MKKYIFEDDGRQIADMSGIEKPNDMLGFIKHRPARKNEKVPDYPDDPGYRQETRAILINALLAALAVAAIFLAATALFILFCTNIWFR
jgi:hypothetical protein